MCEPMDAETFARMMGPGYAERLRERCERAGEICEEGLRAMLDMPRPADVADADTVYRRFKVLAASGAYGDVGATAEAVADVFEGMHDARRCAYLLDHPGAARAEGFDAYEYAESVSGILDELELDTA